MHRPRAALRPHDDVVAIISTAGATIAKAGSHYRVPLLREFLDTTVIFLIHRSELIDFDLRGVSKIGPARAARCRYWAPGATRHRSRDDVLRQSLVSPLSRAC